MSQTFAKTHQERWLLTGKKALITGGTKGIGLAIAQEFLSLGAEVTIVARNSDEITQQVQTYKQQGLEVHGIAADVATPEGRQSIIQYIHQVFSSKLESMKKTKGSAWEPSVN